MNEPLVDEDERYEEVPRVLRPGEEYALWPNMKWFRAHQLVNEFRSSVHLYSGSSRAGLDAEIAEDGLSATFYARELASPPLHEWSLLLGDIFHNYRSALDALAWELVHLDGGKPEPQFEKRVYFPICLTEKSWKAQVEGPLASVPSDVIGRLRAVQPFPFPPADEGIFAILHRLDIQDKHKGQLQADMAIADPSGVRFSFRYEDGRIPTEEEAGQAVVEWVGTGNRVQAGELVFRATTVVPFTWVGTDMPLPISLYVEESGKRWDVFQLLDLIERQTDITFFIVNNGQPPPAELDLSAAEE